eukprot:COSAG01_NODE_50006_length_367_cov_0.861940_2_plen_63_part_01
MSVCQSAAGAHTWLAGLSRDRTDGMGWDEEIWLIALLSRLFAQTAASDCSDPHRDFFLLAAAA